MEGVGGGKLQVFIYLFIHDQFVYYIYFPALNKIFNYRSHINHFILSTTSFLSQIQLIIRYRILSITLHLFKFVLNSWIQYQKRRQQSISLLNQFTTPLCHPAQSMNQACTVAEENENIVCNAKNHIVIKSVSSSFDKKARLNTQNQSMYEKIIRRQSLAQQNSRPVLLLKKDFLNCKANDIQEEKNQNQPFLEQVAEDPQFVPEYVGTCIKYMIQRENKKMVSLQKLQRCQKYVHQREEIVDWICCLHNSMGLAEEIFPIAINFLDRFLSETTDSSEDIELIALTCLFMASKLEQTFGNVSINFFISVSGLDQSVDSLLAMEDKIVNALQFQLIYDTPHKYFQLFARIADLSHKNKYLGQFFIELALTHIKSLGFSASKMAASALYSIHKLRKVVPAWPSSLQSLTGYKESDFVDCVRFLSILMHENYGQFGTKIRSKFSKESKCSVSNIKLYRKIQ